jgi:fatty acid kinase fatty acid binding subunit
MVAIVTDSAANLPAELVGELGIHVVPMHLTFGDGTYRDGLDLAPSDFYRRLLDGREVASTSTPSPGDFLEAYRGAGDGEILCVTIASSMSGASHEARLAGDSFDGRVEVLDSGSVSMGEGFVAVEAARAVRSGALLSEAAVRATEVAERSGLFATADSFEFLRRSGRVTKLQAYAATMLDIKPVFGLRNGEIYPVARPRTRRRALERVVEEALAAIAGRPVHLAAIHAAALEGAQALIERIASETKVVERFVLEVTPVLGVHTGPGAVGLAFFCD